MWNRPILIESTWNFLNILNTSINNFDQIIGIKISGSNNLDQFWYVVSYQFSYAFYILFISICISICTSIFILGTSIIFKYIVANSSKLFNSILWNYESPTFTFYGSREIFRDQKSLGNWLYFLIAFKIRHRTLRTTLHPEKRRPEQLPHQRPKMAISQATMNLTQWWKRKHRKRKTAPETEMPTRIRTQNSVPHLQLKRRITETVRKRQICTYFSRQK